MGCISNALLEEMFCRHARVAGSVTGQGNGTRPAKVDNMWSPVMWYHALLQMASHVLRALVRQHSLFRHGRCVYTQEWRIGGG
jgi:hypothetical protein